MAELGPAYEFGSSSALAPSPDPLSPRDGVADFGFPYNVPTNALTLYGTRKDNLFSVFIPEVEPEPVDEPDLISPVVGNFDPPLGTVVQSDRDLEFDVTDDSGLLRRVIVTAVFSDGVEEIVHDGSTFRGNYQLGLNSRTTILGGFHYSVLRLGGWPSSPEIRIFAFDRSGNEVVA